MIYRCVLLHQPYRNAELFNNKKTRKSNRIRQNLSQNLVSPLIFVKFPFSCKSLYAFLNYEAIKKRIFKTFTVSGLT